MKDKLFSTKNLVRMALFAALATVVMLFKFPLPFAPSFYKLDFSEAIVLLSAFVLGPVAGVIVEFVKVALNLLMDGTTTMYVGEISNFLMGAALVVPASLVYHRKKDFTGALIGVVTGGVCMVVVAAVLNYFVLLPAYSTAFGLELEKIIAMGTAINPSINSLLTFVLLATVPMNLLKAVCAGVLTLLLTKYTAKLLKV